MTKAKEVEREKDNPWNDDVMKGIKYVYSLLSHIASERSQLYGTLAVLMEQNNLEEVTVTIEDFKHAGEELYVHFEPIEGKEGLIVRLVKQGEEVSGDKS